jgi:arsenate reductase-like glutaredoxin family protein
MKKQELKQLLEDTFKYLSQLSVKEYTLYRKYTDIKDKHPINEDTFFGVDTS